MVSFSHLKLSPLPSFKFICSVNMLHHWGTGQPYSSEARAEAAGYLGSLACRGHLGIFPRPLRLSVYQVM